MAARGVGGGVGGVEGGEVGDEGLLDVVWGGHGGFWISVRIAVLGRSCCIYVLQKRGEGFVGPFRLTWVINMISATSALHSRAELMVMRAQGHLTGIIDDPV